MGLGQNKTLAIFCFKALLWKFLLSMANYPPAFTRKENISMHSKNKSTDAASLNLSGQKPCNDSFISFKNLEEAHGIIPYGMTNDYMFRAVLQSNEKVLQGLICSLLHLSKREITSIEIINPVILGTGQTALSSICAVPLTIPSTARIIGKPYQPYILDSWILPCSKNVRNFMPHIN